MEQTFFEECCDYAYICIDKVIASLVACDFMTHVEAYSFMIRLLKGNAEYAPLKVYRRPALCLPFDSYDEVEQLDRDFILTELRDAAYRGIKDYSSLDFVSRKALLVRLQAAGMTIPKPLEHQQGDGVASSQENAKGRVSIAVKVAIIALMEQQGIPVEANATRAAAILTSLAEMNGYSYVFNKDTVTNWKKEASQHKGNTKKSAA